MKLNRKALSTLRTEESSFITRSLSRRSLLQGAGAMTLGTIGLQWLPTRVSAQTLPEGAAPVENQVYRVPSTLNVARTLDMYESIYDRPWLDCLASVPLFKLNRNFGIENAMVDSYESNEEGTVWTFKLIKDFMWSDGNPTTAEDFVHTFQYAADPSHAWDFAWFWQGNITNWTEALAGDVPTADIGVKVGNDEYELIFETVEPAPYMPIKLLYSPPMSKAAMEKDGPLYNSKVETQCMNGPWKLDSWELNQTMTFSRSDTYSGDKDAIPLQQLIIKFADATTHFTLFETDQVDFMEGPAPADLQLMSADPDKANQIYQGVGDFASYYFFFDTSQPPFDDLKVRQAFSHIADREAMKQAIWSLQANPAQSYLMTGFPGSNGEALKDIQNYDPDAAKSLLEEAGYPNGAGFPKIVLNTRGGARPIEYATADAYAAAIKEQLNIDVEVQMIDRPTFYEYMSAKPTKIQLGMVSYGMDYFDASNMLGVWLTGGRHPWSNAEFDKLVNEATVLIGDDEKRLQMFHDAEKILVEDCPAVFTYWYTPVQFIKPYITGPALEADDSGIKALHWPGYGTYATVPEELWVSADAPGGRQ